MKVLLVTNTIEENLEVLQFTHMAGIEGIVNTRDSVKMQCSVECSPPLPKCFCEILALNYAPGAAVPGAAAPGA